MDTKSAIVKEKLFSERKVKALIKQFDSYYDSQVSAYNEQHLWSESEEAKRINEDERRKMQQRIKECWIRLFGKYVETDPEITFHQKKFVLTFYDNGEMRQKITAFGGLIRTAVSGVTDYLVVDPERAGTSQIVKVIELQSQGKSVIAVWIEDLKKALDTAPMPKHCDTGIQPELAQEKDDKTMQKNKEKLGAITEELQKRIAGGDSKVQKAEDLEKRYPDLPISSYRRIWIIQCTGKSAKEYLIENGILMNTRELYLSRIDNSVKISFKHSTFLFEESERFRTNRLQIEDCLKQLGGAISIDQKRGEEIENWKKQYGDNWRSCVRAKYGFDNFYFGNTSYFVVDPTDKSIDGEDYRQINLDRYQDRKVITFDYFMEQIYRQIQSDKDLLKEFCSETADSKLKRALEMFARCVETVERGMDRSRKYDYDEPCILNATLNGKTEANPARLKEADAFFDAIEGWMKTHKMGYDFNNTPEKIKQWASHRYYERVNSGGTDLWGLSGVRCPIAIAVAFINYAAPVADIELEWAHDRWEWSGDYSSGHLLGLKLTKYNTKEELTHYYDKEREM